MATRSCVGYYREENPETGEKFGFMGCYVHYDGYQSHLDVYKRFGTDTKAIKSWIDEGIEGGGYRNAVDAEPYGKERYPVFLGEAGFDYYWLLNEETGLLECMFVRGTDGAYVIPELVGYVPLPLPDDEVSES